MRNRTGSVSLECPNDLERLREDPHMAVIAADKEVVRAGTYGVELITLAESAIGFSHRQSGDGHQTQRRFPRLAVLLQRHRRS